MKAKFLIMSLLLLQSCGIYSLSGVNLEGAETISFKYFNNEAAIVYPDLSIMLYEEMYNRFVSQTALNYQQRDGDILFEGKITGYSVNPIDIKAGETAAYNRLTITILITYKNFKNPKNNFEKSFSWYSDYNASDNLSDVEAELTKKITEKLVDDIFNSSVINW